MHMGYPQWLSYVTHPVAAHVRRKANANPAPTQLVWTQRSPLSPRHVMSGRGSGRVREPSEGAIAQSLGEICPREAANEAAPCLASNSGLRPG
jgi:hypothetical protein